MQYYVAYNTHHDTLWYTILQYFTLPQNDPPWIDKGIQWPLRRFLHLPQFTNLSKQLMDNNILSQQPQHNNNNTSLKTIMDNNNVFRLQRHHRPFFQWLNRKFEITSTWVDEILKPTLKSSQKAPRIRFFITLSSISSGKRHTNNKKSRS